MKYDMIIGNPPYQNVNKGNKNAKLWYDFSILAANSDAEVIALVTPEAAFKDIDSNGKKMRDHMTKLGYGLVDFQRHNGKWFNVGVATSHWIVQKNAPKSLESGVFGYTDQINIDICEKVISYPNKLEMFDENTISKDELSDDGAYEFYWSGQNTARTDVVMYTTGKKMVFPFSASYKSMFFTSDPVAGFNKAVTVKNKKEADMIMEYCLSDLFVFVANHYKKTSGFTPFVKNELIPDLREVDHADLYSLFNLTLEEIEVVQNYVG